MSEQDGGFKLPYEVVDQITLASLKQHRGYLQSDLDKWRDNPKTEANPTGHWMHPEDVRHNEILIHHMNAIIAYYGG